MASLTRAKTDKKEYRLLKLGSNGLEVFLVSDQSSANRDEEEDEEDSQEEDEEEEDCQEEEDDDDESSSGQVQRGGCAVAMAVNCGSFHESAEDPHGLAHLLEHMLFMGSSKYPDENAYDDYLSKHGGYSNAYTETEHTMYYFEIGSAQAMPQAMDLFAQFFIAPLMKEDSLAREIHAVDSEFDLTVADDEIRMRSLWHVTAAEEASPHPAHRFVWGNKQSLMPDNTQVLQQQLRALYDKYYRAENMRLVVWSTDSLDVMQQQVEECFSAVPRGNGEKPPVTGAGVGVGPFSPTDTLGHVFHIIPVNDQHNLRLTWQCPPVPRYTSKPSSYLAHLLGHESDGGLFALLRDKRWATDVYAGTSTDDGQESNSMFSLFAVDIKLTLLGVERVDDVIEAVYAYLGMLGKEGVCVPWVFDELATVAQMAFDYKDDGEPSDQCTALATRLVESAEDGATLLRERDLLTYDALMFNFVEDDVKQLFACLGCSGDRAPRIDLASSTFGREADYTEQKEWRGEVEPHWKTKFTRRPMSNELISRCQHALSNNGGGGAQFSLPPRNDYIPASLAVHPLPSKRRAREQANALCYGLLDSKLEIHTCCGGKHRKQKMWLPCAVVGAREKKQKDEDEDAAAVVECQLEYETGEREWGALQSSQRQFEDQCVYLMSSSSSSTDSDSDRVRVLTAPHLPATPQLAVTPSALMRVWHLQDSLFQVPRAALFCLVQVDPPPAAVEWRVMADLVCSVCVNHVLSHHVYLAKMAELDLKLRYQEQEGAFCIRVLGFSPKVVLLVKQALECLLRHVLGSGLISPEVFAFEKEALLREYVNGDKDLDVQANTARYRALLKTFSKQQLHDALLALDAPPAAGAGAAARVSHVECLFHGNVNQQDVDRAVKEIGAVLAKFNNNHNGTTATTVGRAPPLAVYELPQASPRYVLLPAHEKADKTVALQMYFQAVRTEDANQVRTVAVCELLESLLEEPFFNELRTQQQVGYVVSCSLRRTLGWIGFAFELSSSKFAVHELIGKVEQFLVDFRKEELEDGDEDELRARARAVRKRLLQKDSGIFEETKRLWSHVLNQTATSSAAGFNEHVHVAHEVSHRPGAGGKFGVSHKEVVRMFDLAFSPRTRRLLAVGVVGGASEITSLEKERTSAPPHYRLYDQVDGLWAEEEVTTKTVVTANGSTGGKRKHSRRH